MSPASSRITALGTYRWTPYYNKMAGREKEEKEGGKEEERNEEERGKFIIIEEDQVT